MIRILMTTDTSDEIWTYCITLCAALRPYNTRILLAALGSALTSTQRQQAIDLPHVELIERHCRLNWKDNPRKEVEQVGAWLLSLSRYFQPDVIHLNDLPYGGLPWRKPVVVVGHHCVLSWWDAVKGQPAPESDWWRYRQIVQHSVRSADHVVAPSHDMLEAMRWHYGIIRQASVIYNGLLPFRSLIEKPTSAPNLIMAKGDIWDESQNLPLLCAIGKQLYHHSPSTSSSQLLILGEKLSLDGSQPVTSAGPILGPDIHPESETFDANPIGQPHDYFSRSFDNTTYPPRIPGAQFLGNLPADMAEHWLARTAIYVSPARYQPFGLSILKAAQAGCALVLGDIQSLREIWGDAAHYVNPEDPIRLYQHLSTLMTNRTLLERMQEKALKRAQRYSASRMAAGYIHLYQSLIEQRQKSSTSSTLSTPTFNPSLASGSLNSADNRNHLTQRSNRLAEGNSFAESNRFAESNSPAAGKRLAEQERTPLAERKNLTELKNTETSAARASSVADSMSRNHSAPVTHSNAALTDSSNLNALQSDRTTLKNSTLNSHRTNTQLPPHDNRLTSVSNGSKAVQKPTNKISEVAKPVSSFSKPQANKPAAKANQAESVRSRFESLSKAITEPAKPLQNAVGNALDKFQKASNAPKASASKAKEKNTGKTRNNVMELPKLNPHATTQKADNKKNATPTLAKTIPFKPRKNHNPIEAPP